MKRPKDQYKPSSLIKGAISIKNINIILFLIIIFVLISTNVFADDNGYIEKNYEVSYDELTLIWQDEFNYNGLPNKEKWSYDVGGHGWGNGEKQYYTENRLENARVEDGVLYITARKEEYEKNDYTSARLVTKNKGDWLYKRIEVRAKLPRGRGTWPAIWMLPTEWNYGAWPSSGEIDIMEHVGFNQGVIHGTVHTKSYNHKIGTQRGKSIKLEDVSNSFHTYSIEWYPHKIMFFVDDIHYYTFNNEMMGWREWPFDTPFHLILNIAVGGGWGGQKGIDDSIWPQTMEVDYVRVYDLNIEKRDNTAPKKIKNIEIESTPIKLDVKWDHSSDDFGIKEYQLFLNDEFVGKSKNNHFVIENLEPDTEYDIYIKAVDFAENISRSDEVKSKTDSYNYHEIPGKIEAEQNLSMDTGIEEEQTEDIGGGINLCYIGDDDQIVYTIDVKKSGYYKAVFRVASVIEGELKILNNQDNILTSLIVPVTNGWQKWSSVKSDKIYLKKGKQKIKILTTIGGYSLNYLEIIKAD